jgi:acyl carrier protein
MNPGKEREIVGQATQRKILDCRPLPEATSRDLMKVAIVRVLSLSMAGRGPGHQVAWGVARRKQSLRQYRHNKRCNLSTMSDFISKTKARFQSNRDLTAFREFRESISHPQRDEKASNIVIDTENRRPAEVEAVREILTQHGRLSIDVSGIDEESDLYGYGLTSLATVGIMLALEDRFDIEFPESMLSRKTFKSVAAITQAVVNLAS